MRLKNDTAFSLFIMTDRNTFVIEYRIKNSLRNLHFHAKSLCGADYSNGYALCAFLFENDGKTSHVHMFVAVLFTAANIGDSVIFVIHLIQIGIDIVSELER